MDTRTSQNTTLLHYLISSIQSNYPDLLNFPSTFPDLERARKSIFNEIVKKKKMID